MRLKLKRIFIFIIFIYLSTLAVHADDSSKGYTVQTFDPQNPDNNVNFLNGDITGVNFLQLPLWIQISVISAIGFGVLGALYCFPFIRGRLKHALDNQKTKEIFYFIQRNPGMTIAELSDEQKMNRGTLKYHLGQLLANNKIMSIRKGKFSRLFYNNTSAMDKENIISLYLRNDKSRDILFTIMDTPGITNQELSAKFDLAKSTTHDYLRSLSNDGVVEFRQDGKFKRCYLMQDVRMILLRYRPQ